MLDWTIFELCIIYQQRIEPLAVSNPDQLAEVVNQSVPFDLSRVLGSFKKVCIERVKFRQFTIAVMKTNICDASIKHFFRTRFLIVILTAVEIFSKCGVPNNFKVILSLAHS